jgi:hypothetical protein
MPASAFGRFPAPPARLAAFLTGIELCRLGKSWAFRIVPQRQRAAIGLKVRHKGSGRLKMPGYDALNDLMNAIDPKAYAGALTAWLQAHSGIVPRSLAIDGKSIGDGKCGMIITLCRHEDGRPVAMIPATGEKEDSEAGEARALLADPRVRLRLLPTPACGRQAALRRRSCLRLLSRCSSREDSDFHWLISCICTRTRAASMRPPRGWNEKAGPKYGRSRRFFVASFRPSSSRPPHRGCPTLPGFDFFVMHPIATVFEK